VKKFFFILALLIALGSLSLCAQNAGNPHFFKLIIQNKKKEILLIKYEGAWEIPGARYKKDETITSCLNQMASDHGVSIKKSKLRALVTFHHEVRTNPTIMFYYKVDYEKGELEVPKWGEDVKWFSKEEAYKVIPFPEMNYIIQKVESKKCGLLEGAFKITYDKETKQRKGFEIIEDLH